LRRRPEGGGPPIGGSGLNVRPLGAAELELFLALPGRGGSRHPQLPDDFFDMVAAGHYRPAWTWVALRGGRLVARAAWWDAPDGDHPGLLDWFELGPDPDRVDADSTNSPMAAAFERAGYRRFGVQIVLG
jgi:hypothetical protein